MNAPDPEMMAVVERLAAFMESGAAGEPEAILADSVTIVENFAPYVFTGQSSWTREMRAHLAGMTDLRHSFEDVHDFSRSGDEAYFALRTGWTGKNNGNPFRETGGWAFVLTRVSGNWRIKAYGWAVTG